MAGVLRCGDAGVTYGTSGMRGEEGAVSAQGRSGVGQAARRGAGMSAHRRDRTPRCCAAISQSTKGFRAVRGAVGKSAIIAASRGLPRRNTLSRVVMSLHKSRAERICQALVFEALAIVIATPLFAWAMGTGMGEMGVLTFANCLIALVWNVGFNTGFDALLRRAGRSKTVAARVVHALLFEAGLFALTLPLAMWWLEIGLAEAFALEVGMVLFFLPYSYVYHWGWDVLRARWLARRARRSSATSA